MNTKRNNLLAVSLSALLAAGSVAGFAGAANAAGQGPGADELQYQVKPGIHHDMKSETRAATRMLHPAASTNEAIRASDGTRLRVAQANELSRSQYQEIKDIKNMAPQYSASIQASIRENPALLKAMKKQNVEIANVVDAQRAADGSLIFYVL